MLNTSEQLTEQDFPMQRFKEFPEGSIDWIFDGEWSKLDNFYVAPFEFQCTTWLTAEHAFAANKTSVHQLRKLIQNADSPSLAKHLGRNVLLCDEWEEIKYQLMYSIVKAKMEQVPEAAEQLEATGDRLIFEGNYWNDDTWGVVKVRSGRKGRNALGVILMAVRSELRALKSK